MSEKEDPNLQRRPKSQKEKIIHNLAIDVFKGDIFVDRDYFHYMVNDSELDDEGVVTVYYELESMVDTKFPLSNRKEEIEEAILTEVMDMCGGSDLSGYELVDLNNLPPHHTI